MTPRHFGIVMMVFSVSMLAIGIVRSGQAGAPIDPRAERPGAAVAAIVIAEHVSEPAQPIRVILPSPYKIR